jgi:hypothetical protein
VSPKLLNISLFIRFLNLFEEFVDNIALAILQKVKQQLE